MIRDMLLVVTLLGAVLIFLLTYHSVRPISRLMRSIEPVNTLDSGSQGLDEVGRIISSVQNIQSENKRMQLELQDRLHEISQEQVRALQSQMDPHFLYNALDTLRWMALEEGKGETELSAMAESLADLFRLSLNRSEYVVPLKDELHHVELYMKVYKRRYQGKLHIHYHISDELLEKRIVKLSIQPIVDNAVKHGLRPKRYQGTIDIYARQMQQRLVITVENNGCLMQDDQIQQMNEALKRNGEVGDRHVGLPNVNKRIKLIYGEAYGVHLEKTDEKMRTVMELPWE